MRLINTLFIICLFGKLINCNNNNDQNKSNDNLVQSASNQQQTTQTGPESRQISGPMNHGGYHDSNSNNINIYANELSPKQSAYHNSHPGAPIGYIKIQPLLASPFASSHHQPEEQGSTTFLNFIKPEKHSRRSLLTNKLKSYISSLLSWKDSTNSNTPYMTSGSSYSYSALHPPFNFQPSPQQHQSSASSQYKSIVFPNYQPNSNGYKFSNTFNPTHLNGNNQQPNNQHSPQSQYYNNQPSASSQLNSYALNSNSLNNLNNPSQTFTTYQNRNQNNLNSNSNLNNNNYNFPPNSFQVASSSNVNSVYTSTSNQYQPSSNQNNQQELNNNQRSETVDSLNDSSSSLNNPGNSSNNPVSNSLKNKQQFNTY